MLANLIRFNSNLYQTNGILKFENGDSVFTLELPWVNNARQISCIPDGEYEVHAHVSPKFGKCYKVKSIGKSEVNGRDEILIHVGNYKRNTLGCILPGLGLTDIDNDGNVDVSDSARALRKIFAIAPDGFRMIVRTY